jgi:hypothetical protein
MSILISNKNGLNTMQETKQSRYAKKITRVVITINPKTEADILASLNALAAVHGGNAQAIKYLLRNAAK